MIPFNKGHPAVLGVSAPLFYGLTGSRTHFGRAFFAAKGTVILSEIAYAVGTFIQIGTVELVVAVK